MELTCPFTLSLGMPIFRFRNYLYSYRNSITCSGKRHLQCSLLNHRNTASIFFLIHNFNLNAYQLISQIDHPLNEEAPTMFSIQFQEHYKLFFGRFFLITYFSNNFSYQLIFHYKVLSKINKLQKHDHKFISFLLFLIRYSFTSQNKLCSCCSFEAFKRYFNAIKQ